MILIALLFSQSLFAANVPDRVEAVTPTGVCDRFYEGADKKRCLALLKKGADSYLTPICELQFENESFFQCLGLAQTSSFDPRKIQVCADDHLEDQERLDCLNKLAKKQIEKSPRTKSQKATASQYIHKLRQKK